MPVCPQKCGNYICKDCYRIMQDINMLLAGWEWTQLRNWRGRRKAAVKMEAFSGCSKGNVQVVGFSSLLKF